MGVTLYILNSTHYTLHIFSLSWLDPTPHCRVPTHQNHNKMWEKFKTDAHASILAFFLFVIFSKYYPQNFDAEFWCSLKLTVKHKAILRMTDNNTLLKIIQIWESDSGVVLDGWVKIHRCLKYTHFYVWNSFGTGGGRGGVGPFFTNASCPCSLRRNSAPRIATHKKKGKKGDSGLQFLQVRNTAWSADSHFAVPHRGMDLRSKVSKWDTVCITGLSRTRLQKRTTWGFWTEPILFSRAHCVFFFL